jgi:hypothetical protein
MRYRIATLLSLPLLLATLSIPNLSAQTVAKPKTADAAKIVEPPAALLPPAFDGWVESAKPGIGTKPVIGTKAADADPDNAAALADYTLERFAVEHYSRPGENGTTDSLTVKAMQFPDATGAFGAFTFYRRPNMAAEDIGSQFAGSKNLGLGGASGPGSASAPSPAAAAPSTADGAPAVTAPNPAAATPAPSTPGTGARILFWSGNILVDAEFSRINAMTASEMRDLAKLLPSASSGHALIPPPLPRYLPATGLEAMSVRYALGNASYQLTGGVLPPQVVGFDRSAEAVTAAYLVGGHDGTLTLIEFPTPQLAMMQEKAVNELFNAIKAPQNGAKTTQFWPESLTSSSPAALQVRRSGPLLAITSGNFTDKQAQTLIGSIHYDADITWNNTQGYISEPTKAARLLVNIILGSSLICLFALALGIALGGGRAMIRVLRGKPASAVDEVFEFTKLNLKD